jgi:xanthine dehydrogenase accessory factor
MTPLQFYQALLAQLDLAQRWCIASVTHTQGSTPRKRGAQMALALDAAGQPSWPLGSIGGGLAEAKVVAAAQSLLSDHALRHTDLVIDLAGSPIIDFSDSHFSGVCGGRMQLVLASASAAHLQTQIALLQAALRAGRTVDFDVARLTLSTEANASILRLQPHPLCVIGGGGHCGMALAEMLTQLGFPVLLVEDRNTVFGCDFAGLNAVQHCMHWQEAITQCASHQSAGAQQSMVILLSRSYQQDRTALSALAQSNVAFALIGMMGSTRRIRLVSESLPDMPSALKQVLRAPIGLTIGAETPQEIALSIAAEVVRAYRQNTSAQLCVRAD